MKTKVELDKKTVKELLRVTGKKKTSLAVTFAVSAFLNWKKARDFGRMLREGVFDYDA